MQPEHNENTAIIMKHIDISMMIACFYKCKLSRTSATRHSFGTFTRQQHHCHTLSDMRSNYSTLASSSRTSSEMIRDERWTFSWDLKQVELEKLHLRVMSSYVTSGWTLNAQVLPWHAHRARICLHSCLPGQWWSKRTWKIWRPRESCWWQWIQWWIQTFERRASLLQKGILPP